MQTDSASGTSGRRVAMAIRVLALAALSVVLAGCFYSSAPKFPLASGAPAFGEGGRYVMYSEHIEADRYRTSEPVTMTRRSDGGYQMMNAKGESVTIHVHALPGGLYVSQSWDESLTRYNYAVLQVTPAQALVFIPQCDAQDKGKLTALGVDVRGLECPIDRVTDPAALFATVTLGEPTSKLVRE